MRLEEAARVPRLGQWGEMRWLRVPAAAKRTIGQESRPKSETPKKQVESGCSPLLVRGQVACSALPEINLLRRAYLGAA